MGVKCVSALRPEIELATVQAQTGFPLESLESLGQTPLPTAEQLDQLRAAGRLKEGETAWYNAGIYIFNSTLFDHTARLEKSPRGEYELTDALTSMLEAEESIAGLEIAGRWIDVRDPKVLQALQDAIE